MARIDMGEVSLEVSITGEGRPLLFLHGGDYFAQNRVFLDRLARRWRVLIPRHPGFGGSERPDGFRSVHDLAYLYLDWLDAQPGAGAWVVGSSFGGWVALEIAVRSVGKIAGLVLIDTLGLKFGGREERDIVDMHALGEDELRRRLFADPARFVPDYASLGDEDLVAIARDREAAALYGWRPYMHDPGLNQWLHRVHTPALGLWGEADGIVTQDYGRKVCAALPRARFDCIAGAGHFPQIERAQAVAEAILRFAETEAVQ